MLVAAENRNWLKESLGKLVILIIRVSARRVTVVVLVEKRSGVCSEWFGLARQLQTGFLSIQFCILAVDDITDDLG